MSDLIEYEWTDKFGTHFLAKGIDKKGFIHQRTIVKDPLIGWTVSWDTVRKDVNESIRLANAA